VNSNMLDLLRRLWLLVLVMALTTSRAEYDIDDSILYKIEWLGPLLPPTDTGSSTDEGLPFHNKEKTEDVDGGSGGLWSGKGDQAVMTSVDNEKYSCNIPKVDPRTPGKEAVYSGPSVLELLEKLFTQQTCAYRLESYWTYELCHGRLLRQYHEERDGKHIKLQEYKLGQFTKDMFDDLVVEANKDLAGGITRHPPTKKIEGMNMPYYEVVMTDGDICDLNKQPRKARVLYVCYPAGKNEIYSLKEVSTCEYEVVVLTASLCSHPSYKPEESVEHGITCRPMEGTLTRKPSKLSQLEIDGLKLRSEKLYEATLSSGEVIRVNIEKIPRGETQETRTAKESQWKETIREPFKPLMDPQVVKEFLKGEYCLYGGSGWWKYEFCYGKKVDQYHEEGGGKKTVVRLGEFKEAEHLQWLEEHPAKKPKMKDSRKQVSIFYSGGDVCDLTGLPRQIEVKMKCKPADSPSTVSLYLLEPKVCEYVLGVESPLICDLLEHADDETGLFPPGLVDRLDLESSPAVQQADRDKLEVLKKKIAEGGLMEDDEAFAKAGEAVIDEDTKTKSSSKRVEESVHIANGVKTIVRRTLVNGLVVASTSETIKVETTQSGDKDTNKEDSEWVTKESFGWDEELEADLEEENWSQEHLENQEHVEDTEEGK